MFIYLLYLFMMAFLSASLIYLFIHMIWERSCLLLNIDISSLWSRFHDFMSNINTFLLFVFQFLIRLIFLCCVIPIGFWAVLSGIVLHWIWTKWIVAVVVVGQLCIIGLTDGWAFRKVWCNGQYLQLATATRQNNKFAYCHKTFFRSACCCCYNYLTMD